MKRVVLDTNVTIAAFFWSGYPRIVYDLILDLGMYNGIQIIKARDFLIKEKYLEK